MIAEIDLWCAGSWSQKAHEGETDRKSDSTGRGEKEVLTDANCHLKTRKFSVQTQGSSACRIAGILTLEQYKQGALEHEKIASEQYKKTVHNEKRIITLNRGTHACRRECKDRAGNRRFEDAPLAKTNQGASSARPNHLLLKKTINQAICKKKFNRLCMRSSFVYKKGFCSHFRN